ncbi:MAG: hypothetical protein AB7P16_30245 [Bradyrhizobium sp.]|uniref:hypothetical protein n=1 Tax=Bradyrhizobium sp. TaxID=376 RepID=UPI003D0F0B3F
MSDRDRDERRGRGYDDDRERYPHDARRGAGNQPVIIALIAAGTIIILVLILVFTGVLGGARGNEPASNQQATQPQAAPAGNMSATSGSQTPDPGNTTAAAPAPAATASASAEFPAEFRGTWCDAAATEFLIFTANQLRVEQRDSSGAVTSTRTRLLTGRAGGEFVLDDGTQFSIFEGPGNPTAIRGGRNIEVDLTRGPLKTYEQC